MKKRYKTLIIISICLNLIVFLVGIKIVDYKGGIKYIYLIANNFMHSGKITSASTTTISKIDEFKNYRSTEKDIVFLGDSITVAGMWSEYFPEESCRNRGISGDRTYNILNRIDSIVEGKPDKIFLLIGINDLIGKVSNEEIFNNYKKILDAIKSKSPNTKIICESILPLNKAIVQKILEKKSTIVETTNNDIKNINSKIEQLCKESDITYVNLYDKFLDDEGELKKELTIDGLHINQNGYLILANEIDKFINK